LTFVTLDQGEWSLLEASWMVDQEPDRSVQRERTFAVAGYDGTVDSLSHPVFTAVLGAYQRVASAARLIEAGTWIDARHLAAVARGFDGFNVRMAGTERPRLWGAVFGAPQTMRARRREFNNRVECRPAQFHMPHGPAYTLDDDHARTIEGIIGVLGQLQHIAPDHSWWAVQRTFDRGNDIFVSRRARLATLFEALETIYGPYGTRGEPGLGHIVAVTGEQLGANPQEVITYVEGDLRDIRNDMAHGRALTSDVELARDEQTLIGFVRDGLRHSLDWIRGAHQPEGPYAPGPERTLPRFRRWLGRTE